MAGGIRIISGSARGRRVACAPGLAVRPTAARVREAVFSILGDRVAGARVLDLYAGAGTLGLEALSRGAARADFVEANRVHAAFIRENLEHMGFADRAGVFCQDVRRFVAQRRPGGYDVAFVDPPYGAGELRHLLPALWDAHIMAPSGIIVVEHAQRPGGPPAGPWHTGRTYTYGKTAITLLHPPGAEPDAGPHGNETE